MTERSDADRRAAASTGRLARVTVVALLVLLGAAAAAGSAVAGADGARSGVLGVALTAILFGGGLLGLVRTAGGSRSFTPVLAAFSLRLVLYASALAFVTRADWVHGPSLAVATAGSLAAMLAVELLVLSRMPAAELELPGGSGCGQPETTEVAPPPWTDHGDGPIRLRRARRSRLQGARRWH